MEGMSLYSSPLLGTPRKEHLVREVLYSDTAHNFGDETETGVTNVRMDMEEEEFSCIVDEEIKGHESDHTGMEIGGGGGITVLRDVRLGCGRESALTPIIDVSESRMIAFAMARRGEVGVMVSTLRRPHDMVSCR